MCEIYVNKTTIFIKLLLIFLNFYLFNKYDNLKDCLTVGYKVVMCWQIIYFFFNLKLC